MLMRHARLHLRAIPSERRSIEARTTTRMGQRRIERDGAGRGGSGDGSVLCATQVPNVEHVLATKHCERPDDVGVLFVTQIFYYNFRCRFHNIHFTPISVPGRVGRHVPSRSWRLSLRCADGAAVALPPAARRALSPCALLPFHMPVGVPPEPAEYLLPLSCQGYS